LPRIFAVKDPTTGGTGIAAAVDALRRGELVAMPTETVYGLAADATNAAAVGAIFLAKGRPRFNPLIVHVASRAAAAEMAIFSPEAEKLAAAFWPGALTLVMPRRADARVVDLVTAGLDTVAVRVPAHPVAQALLAALGEPVAAPSANRSGRVSPTTAGHVAEDFGDEISVILDAGPTPIGIESTIVGFAGGRPVLLRAGGIGRTEIEAALGGRITAPSSDPSAPLAPGMLASHYAPAAALRLNVKEVRAGEGLIAFGRNLPDDADQAAAVRNLSPGGDLAEAAANFFAALRDLDRVAGTIAVVPIPEEGLGEAINDRLGRAAAPRSQTSDSSSRA
jgi:L-threonylcarbamoyladenylate synthase